TREALSAEGGMVGVVDAARGVISYQEGYGPWCAADLGSIPLSSTLPAAQCLQSREPIFVDNLQRHPPQQPELRARLDHLPGLDAGAMLPVLAGSTPLGVLFYGTRRRPRFSPRERRYMCTLASLCGRSTDRSRESREAQEARRTMEDLFTLVSHELRTPVTVLQLQVERLLGERSSEARDFERLRGQVFRLSHVVENVMSYSQVRAGALRLVHEAVALDDIMAAAVEQLRWQVRYTEAPIRVAGDTGIVGEWDREALQLAFVNLLMNATIFGRQRAVEVFVRREFACACVTIRDGGDGIPHEDRSRVFEPFVRLNSVRTHGGLGIGLCVARAVVDALGGNIDLASEPAGGTVVSVRLPRSSN
ncbi:MAG TPA: GAF domain-containing sensor histidine kinase, partial [Myxococcota bacterium]|nr:GAF domain-containing sensor histidine kinase [Myxococcota bacterium]